ncbi:MAG: hypothetical protein LBH84_06070 [Prevotellaceae bacterium]|nr:hypothetical protein [Prevotellaceae bacterium]
MKTKFVREFLLLAVLAQLSGCEIPISDLEQREVAGSVDEHLKALLVGVWYVDNPAVGTPCMSLEREGVMRMVEYDSAGVELEVTGAWRIEDDVFTKIVRHRAQNFDLVMLTSKTLVYREISERQAHHSFHRGQ